jgi:prophage maintenance system killer protein
MKTPRWLSELMVYAIHKTITQKLGNCCMKIQDATPIDGILLKPQQLFHHHHADFATLAASYGFHLARQQIFVTYNVQVAWLAIYTFLGLNGIYLQTTEAETFDLLNQLKNQQITEIELATWLRARMIACEHGHF